MRKIRFAEQARAEFVDAAAWIVGESVNVLAVYHTSRESKEFIDR
jgi:hypothetical protein